MKHVIKSIFAAALLFAFGPVILIAATGSWNGVAFTNLNGVVQVSWNGTSISCAGGGGFNPQTQGTLVNWYDASTLGLSNGAAISTWIDSKTGNPNPLTTSGTAPQYATNQQNGLGVAQFFGFNQLNVGGSSASTYPYTIAIVIYIANVSDYGRPILVSNTVGAGGLYTNATAVNGYINADNNGTANIGTGNLSIGTGAYHLIVLAISSSTWAYYVDGASAGSGSNAASLTAGTTFVMGGNGGGFAGNIGEIQIYNSVLSGGDLTALHTYIVNKWATP